MKIAICISGMPRNIENSYQWLKEAILDVLDKKKIFWYIIVRLWGKSSDKDIMKFVEVFKPCVCEFEEWTDNIADQIGWQEFQKNKFEIEPRASCLGQFYNIYKCNELKNRYELLSGHFSNIVIRTRTELKFNNKLDIKELEIINNSESPTIFLRQGPNPQNLHWYKDNFAIMNPSGADIYSDCTNHLLNVSSLTKVSTAELILRNWLDLNKVSVYHTSLNYTITRN